MAESLDQLIERQSVPVAPVGEQSLDDLILQGSAPVDAAPEVQPQPPAATAPEAPGQPFFAPGDDILRNLVTQGAFFGAGDEFISAARVPFQMAIGALQGELLDPRDLFAKNQQMEAAQLAATREGAPILSTAADIGGALMTGGAGAARLIGQIPSRLGRAGAAVGTGAAAGGVQAFATGDTLEERVGAVPGGAALGAGVGAAGAVAAPVVSRIASSGPVRRATKAAAKALDVSKGTLARISRGFDESVNTGTLRAAEKGDLLLDLSPAFRAQAEAIAQAPGEAGQRILSAVHQRAAGAGGRIQDALDQGLGTDIGRTLVRRAQKDEQKAAGRMFEEAKKSDAVFDMAGLRGSLNQNADILLTQGGDSLRRLLERLPDGAVNAQTLHFVRQSLDDEIGKSVRAGTGNLTRALMEVRRHADVNLKSIPGWREADRAFQLAKQKEQAFDQGRGIFQTGQNAMSPDELAEHLNTIDPSVREVFAQGARDAISRITGVARNDGGAAIRELSEKGWNRDKLRLVIGDDKKSRRLLNTLEREQRTAGTKQVVTQGSQTARRLAAQREFAGPIGAVGTEIPTGVSSAAMQVLRNVADRIARGALTARSGKFADETSRLLTSAGLERDRVIAELGRLRQAKGAKLTRAETTEALMNMLPGTGGQAGAQN